MHKMKAYNSVTLEPEQATPFHDWPHGSPPPAVHPVSCEGECMLLNITLRAETTKWWENPSQTMT